MLQVRYCFMHASCSLSMRFRGFSTRQTPAFCVSFPDRCCDSELGEDNQSFPSAGGSPPFCLLTPTIQHHSHRTRKGGVSQYHEYPTLISLSIDSTSTDGACASPHDERGPPPTSLPTPDLYRVRAIPTSPSYVLSESVRPGYLQLCRSERAYRPLKIGLDWANPSSVNSRGTVPRRREWQASTGATPSGRESLA